MHLDTSLVHPALTQPPSGPQASLRSQAFARPRSAPRPLPGLPPPPGLRLASLCYQAFAPRPSPGLPLLPGLRPASLSSQALTRPPYPPKPFTWPPLCCCTDVTEGWMVPGFGNEAGVLWSLILAVFLTIILTGLSIDCTTLSICGARSTTTPEITSEHSPPTPTTHTGSTKLGGRRERKGEG